MYTHWEGRNENRTITNISKDVEKLEPLYIVCGIENDAASLENSLTVFQNIKPRVITRCSNSTVRYDFREKAEIHPRKNLYMNVHSSQKLSANPNV